MLPHRTTSNMQKIPYPDWWIQRASARRVALDDAVARLKQALPELPQVQGVLIFGSYVRGDIGPESDLDLIFVQETDQPLIERGAELREALFPILGVPYDLIVYTPEEYQTFTREWPFAAQARNEGIWLDARPSR